MRDYSKVSPQFWIGATGKKLRAAGPEAQLVAMYLMTCSHANMLGLYYLPIMYVAHETGLGMEGASKGLIRAIEAGFCSYDEASECVWVVEMAAYQVGDELTGKDLRIKGVQRDYDALPENPFLSAFFDKYSQPFKMEKKREATSPLQAPYKPLLSQEQEQEQEQEQKTIAPALRSPKKSPNPINDKTWQAYSGAFFDRYGTEPVRNAKVNSQIAAVVTRLGDDAPHVAAFYLTHNGAWYVQHSHTTDSLLKDAEALRTQWATNRTVTQHQARSADKFDETGHKINAAFMADEVY